MALDTETLKSNISKYIKNELSKKDLENWSKTEFNKLVTGEIVYLNKIVFYKILSQLIQINDPIDPLPKSDVVDILNILEGTKDKNYSFKMNIPPKKIEKELVRLADILTNYMEHKSMTKEEWNIISSLTTTAFEFDNIVDRIKYQIFNVLTDSFEWIDDEGVYFFKGSMLFIEMNQISEDMILNKIIKYLNWLIGKDFIIVNIAFIKGVPYTAFLG